MYSQIAASAAGVGVGASAVASGFAPMHVAVVVGASVAGAGALVGLLRVAYRHARVPRR